MSVKVQCVRRGKNGKQQWFVSLPATLVRSLEIAQGENVEWHVSDENHLLLCRTKDLASESKPEKKANQVCSMNFWDFLKLLGV